MHELLVVALTEGLGLPRLLVWGLLLQKLAGDLLRSSKHNMVQEGVLEQTSDDGVYRRTKAYGSESRPASSWSEWREFVCYTMADD